LTKDILCGNITAINQTLLKTGPERPEKEKKMKKPACSIYGRRDFLCPVEVTI